MTSYI